jgi:superfamily I DNA/RNA helicase
MSNLSDAMLCTKTKMRTASEYQINIFRHATEQMIDPYLANKPVTNAVVQAVAGSGKTTTIVGVAQLIPASINSIFLAFNTDIAKELKTRLPQSVDAKTLNSLGWRICFDWSNEVQRAEGRSKIGWKEFTNGRKIWDIIRDRSVMDKKEAWDYGKDVNWVIGKAMSYGIVPSSLEDNGFKSVDGQKWDIDTWLAIVKKFEKDDLDIAVLPTVLGFAEKVIIESYSRTNVVNFDEQKYWAVTRLTDEGEYLPRETYDLIIIDEVQDVSPVDRALIQLSLKEGGMVMGVGDTNQSIYGFRGADTDSIQKFCEVFNAIELPLSITYRCGKRIVEAAQRLVPHIEAAPTAHDGAVDQLDEYDASEFNPAAGDMIICRNNAPIVSFAYKLIRGRIPVFVKGRDIGKGIIELVEKVGGKDVLELDRNLNLWETQQYNLIDQNDPDDDEAKARIADRAETLRVFISENGDNKVSTVKTEIESLFDTRGYDNDKKDAAMMKGKVVLSTIHKAKGLEGNTVFFLDAFLLYPRFIQKGTWQWKQEQNVEYVAITRAINRLAYITTKGFKDKGEVAA